MFSKTSEKELSCADRLKVLADPTRLAIIQALMEAACQVQELQRAIGIEQTLLSHHLRILRRAGLIISQPQGRARLYHLAEGVKLENSEAINLGCCLLAFEPDRKKMH